MDKINNNEYFALVPTERIGEELNTKVEGYYDHLNINGYTNLWQKVQAQYYRGYYNNGSIVPYGSVGEKKILSVNHFRNLLEHIKVLTTNERPVFQPRAINNDYKSYVQTKFAGTLLDYYMKQKGLEDVIDAAVDFSLIGGEGIVMEEWDKNKGKIVGEMEAEVSEEEEENEEFEIEEDEEGNIVSNVKREGDAVFHAYHPIDVVRDWNKDNSEDNTWYIVRKRINKFELASKYPKKRDDIISASTSVNEYAKESTLDVFDQKRFEDGDQIYSYVFRHDRTSAIPNGRQVEFLEDGTVLFDGDLPYEDIGIYSMMFANKRGSNFGYTIAYDLLPLQKAVDMLDSTIVSNQNAFGTQNILIKKGSGVQVSTLSDGLRGIEYHGENPPAPLKLLSTPTEIFNYKNDLIQQMETISGVNSVSRGNPEASLKSGAALALVQSMAIQFNSGLQHAYSQALERIGTGLVSILRDYAQAPRVALVAGIGSKSYLKEFTGDDLNQVDRVIVEVGNPLSKTISGKLSIADTLVERGLISTPEQYIQVLETGRLEPIIESESMELMSIRSENEVLANPELGEERPMVKAFFADNHSLHIREHSGIIASVEARNDAEMVTRVASHIQEHIMLLKTTDPAFLMLNGQQPLAPMIAPPVPNQDIPNTPTQGQSPQPTAPGEQVAPGAQPGLDAGMPSLPSMPNNALTGEDFNTEDGGLKQGA